MEALQTREYIVKFNGRTYNQRVELHKSGAFNYGNGTAVYYYDGVNFTPQMFDTRYEHGITEDFDKWADKFIINMCNPECKINAVLK